MSPTHDGGRAATGTDAIRFRKVTALRYNDDHDRFHLPLRLRSLLRRAVDFFGDSGDAAGQARRRSLHSAHAGKPVRNFWRPATSGSVLELASRCRDVWQQRRCDVHPRSRHGVFEHAGAGYAVMAFSWKPYLNWA